MTGLRGALSDRQFRILDVATKLIGVALIAIGLETGIATAPGVGLVIAGVLLGVSTAFHMEETQ